MAIPVKRWESLDKDFNVGVQDFSKIGKEIGGTFNDAMASANDLAGEIKGVLTDLKGVKDDALNQAMDAIKEATRFADDVLGTFTDLTKIPEQVLDDVLKSILPSGSSSNASKLKSTIKTCRNNALGRGLGISNKLPSASCGGGKFRVGSCSANGAGTMKLLDDILGGNGLLGQAQKAVGNALKKIVALASIGYGADLCGAFAAVTNGITDRGVLTKAAGGLLNSFGLDGNFKAVGDITKNLSGLNIGALMPDTLKNVAQNIPMPLGFGKNDVSHYGEMVSSVLGEIDDSWMGKNGSFDSFTGGLGELNNTVSHSLWSHTAESLSLNDLEIPSSSKLSQLSSSYSGGDFSDLGSSFRWEA